jgi:hypothetical protein
VDDTTEVGGRPRIPTHNYLSHCGELVRSYSAIVTIGTTYFLVYGYENANANAVTNQYLAKIKPRTVWKGEVLVLVLGNRVPFQARPCIKLKIIDEAAAL